MSGQKHLEMFRVRIHGLPKSVFSSAIGEEERPSAVFQCVQELPKLPSSPGRPTWRVGGFTSVEGTRSALFEFGKVTKVKRGSFDDQAGEFCDLNNEEACRTSMFVNMEEGVQILGISPSGGLAPNTARIADMFEKTLNHNLEKLGICVTIRFIPDDSGFVEKLVDVHTLATFSVTLGQLNKDLDEEDLLYNPVGKVNARFRSDKAQLTFHAPKGKDLHRETAVQISNSAMKLGNPVKAKVRDKSGGKLRNISPDKYPARVDIDAVEDNRARSAGNIRKGISRWWSQIRKRDKS